MLAPRYAQTCSRPRLKLAAFHHVLMVVTVHRICGGMEIRVNHSLSVAVILMVFHIHTILSGRQHAKNGKLM